MLSKFQKTLFSLCVLTLSCYGSSRAEDRAEPKIHDFTRMVTPLADIEATVKVSKFDSAELEKIGTDFKNSYSLRSLNFQYKQPDKMKLEGHSPTRGRATIIFNGAIRFYEAPKFKLKNRENLETQSGKRQSLLEYVGLISPVTLKFMNPKYLKDETIEGRETEVYELTFNRTEKGSFYRVWMDTKSHAALKREWFDGAGKLKATFNYLDLTEPAPGVWIPNKVEVKNGEGVSAAILMLSEIKVNQGLTEEPFKVAPAP